ncbi:MAG: alpha-amylase family glycosyl hydrolase [Candidatus Solibacter sp.]
MPCPRRRRSPANKNRPFWEKGQAAIDKQYPNLIVTGEITAPSPAVLSFFEGGTRRAGVDTRLKSMLDFPLESAIRKVFAEGQPMTLLTDILSQDSLYQHPEQLVAFSGNHDQPRFFSIAGGDVMKQMMAQAFLLTTRRIPHIYYGEELAMGKGTDRTDRSIRADFPGGWPGDPVNGFVPSGRSGESSLAFDYLRDLLHFRQQHPAVRQGKLVQLLVNKDQYAYLRSSPGEHVLVILNRAGAAKPIELDLDDVGVPNGIRFTPLTKGQPEAVVAGGTLTIPDPKEIYIYSAQAQAEPRPSGSGDFPASSPTFL